MKKFANSLDTGQTKYNVEPDLSQTILRSMVVFLKEVFEKDDFENNQHTTKRTNIIKQAKVIKACIL